MAAITSYRYWTPYRQAVVLSVASALVGAIAVVAGACLIDAFGPVACSATVFSVAAVASIALGRAAYSLFPYRHKDIKTLLGATYGQYSISDSAEPWISFFNKASDPNDLSKVHISIKGDRPQNMAKAFDVIFPILLEYNSPSFKILPPGEQNEDGKEVVIYANNMPDAAFTKMLEEIVEKLGAAGVIAGPPSLGDVEVPGGRGYVYTRAPGNLFGAYIHADFLHYNHFTTHESAHISEGRPFNWRLYGALPVQAPPVEAAVFASIRVPQFEPRQVEALANHCLKSFHQLLEIKWNKKFSTYDHLFGVDKRRPVGPAEDAIRKSFATPAFNAYLEKAARVTALAYLAAFPRGNYTAAGRITPAIYHHYIKPLAEAARSGQSLQLTPEQEKAFIKAVVKCTFRDGVQKTATPKYKEQFTEAQLDDLIDSLLLL